MQLAIRITLSTVSPDPTYAGGPFVGGVMKMGTANPAIFAWPIGRLVECGSFGERVDIVTGGNYSQLLDFSLSVSNHDKWYADFETAGASLIGALVEIGEAISDDDLDPKWAGTVADANFQGMNVELRVENILASRHKIIPSRILTVQEFSTLRSEFEGAVVPTIYGPVIRSTPSSLLSEQDAKNAVTIYNSDGDGTTEDRANTWVAFDSSIAPPSLLYCPVISSIDTSGVIHGVGYSSDHWLPAFIDGKTVYMSIVSGAGSGQDRKIASIATGNYYSYTEGLNFDRTSIINVVDAALQWVGCTIAAPFDTLPDATSVISFFVQEVGAVLAASDEGIISKVYSTKDGVDYTLAFTQSMPATEIVGADISSEFKNGEDYAALNYEKPSEVYGITALSDGLTTSSGQVSSYMKMSTGSGYTYGDALCRGKLFLDSVPSDVIDSDPDIYLLASLDAISPTADLWVQFVGQQYDNTQDFICQSVSTLIGLGEPSVNSYSPAILPDGISGAFSAYALKIPSLPAPLEKYRCFRFGIMVRDSPLTPVPTRCGPSTWTNGATSVVFSAAITDPQIGDWIRPDDQNLPRITSEYYRDRFFYGSSHVSTAQDWRQITNVTTLAYQRWQLDFADPITCPTDDYNGILVPDSSIVTATEYECGIAFVHSAIPKDDTFLVDFSSGRTYSTAWPALPSGKAIGDPITLARDAVLDLYYRDLGLGASAVDFASFQALPSDPITSALVERVDSAERVASLCEQFNWVVGHDSLGRETATAWLSRVGSTEYDYSIDTSDVIEGTLTGIAVSDVIDLVNNPNMKWDWTQADGFRQESNVVDVTMDPLLLNSSNYLRYITGFGDFSTALDVYQSLHKSFQINNRQNSSSFEFPDVGSDASGVLWPSIGMSRFDWIASRKPIFQLSVPDTSASAFPPVGKRVRLKHKRYAPNWVHGTIVETSIDPMTAETAITIMGDPTQLASGDNELYIDTIDPSGTIEQYIDQTDGTSEQYTDNIAGA